MKASHLELPGLWVSVDKVEYCPEASTPNHKPFQFAYYITIHNDSPRVVIIVGRKWVVTNAKGHKLVVEGEGIVGQSPRLTPGDQFHYSSYHLLDSDSVAEGVYLAKDEDDNPITLRIPSFAMRINKPSPKSNA